jgi:hypothetical protein
LLKLIQAFESKPAFTGVFASALCLLIVAGIVYTDNPTGSQDSQASGQVSQNGEPLAAMTPAFLDASAATPASQVSFISSTNPATSLDSGASPFGNPNPLLQPVSFNH